MKLNLKFLPITCLVAMIIILSGCDMLDMYDQKKFKTYGRTDFFADKRQSRPLIEGTVARGELKEDEHFFAGTIDGKLAEHLPFSVTRDDLLRGRDQFNVYCAPCHGQTAEGNGMIVQRGYRPPPTLHSDTYRSKPVGHFYQVVTNGFGAMPAYASQVDVKDRWLIASYIQALQLSQNMQAKELTEDERLMLDSQGASSKNSSASGEHK